jgi:hypothetical protein
MPAIRKTLLTRADPIPGRGVRKGRPVPRAKAGTPDVRSADAVAREVERQLRAEGFRMCERLPHDSTEGYYVNGGGNTVSVYYFLPGGSVCHPHSRRQLRRRSRALTRVRAWLRGKGYRLGTGEDRDCILCEGP